MSMRRESAGVVAEREEEMREENCLRFAWLPEGHPSYDEAVMRGCGESAVRTVYFDESYPRRTKRHQWLWRAQFHHLFRIGGGLNRRRISRRAP